MATITQIAARLNLNKSTVSRALNNRPVPISGETRELILRAAREMGYAPNPAARALTAARSGNIGLVSRQFNNSLYTALHQELAIAVDARGGNLVSCVTGRDAAHHGQDHLLHPGTVDGILAFPYALSGLDSPESPWMRRPIVFLLSIWEEDKAPSVRFDDAAGAADVARHLWALGHRRLLLIQGMGPTNVPSTFGVERYAFLRAAWSGLGGNSDRDITERAEQATAEGGYRAMTAALEPTAGTGAAGGATAVVAYSDQMALGALRALQEQGLQVPRDFSLVGWNDLDDVGQFLTPSLTSVRTSPRELAEAAVELLFHRIDASLAPSEAAKTGGNAAETAETEIPARVRIPVGLVLRESTGKVGG